MSNLVEYDGRNDSLRVWVNLEESPNTLVGHVYCLKAVRALLIAYGENEPHLTEAAERFLTPIA